MNERLSSWAASRGYQVAWGPASVVEVVRGEIEHRMASGELDAAFSSDQFEFSYPRPAPDGFAVVVAVPRPAHRVRFQGEDGPFEALLPPTYFRYRGTYKTVRDDLAANGLPGFRAEPLTVPLKALAARLGLVRYGRNNLAYAAGVGSYMQLVGCLTDAPLTVSAGWEPAEPALLDECARCEACRRRCPSGAITRERVLLRAEQCLTLASETEGAWPGWVGPSMHNAFIGCLECQRVCPANPRLPVADSGVSFSADETALLMSGTGGGPGWPAIARKFEQLGQEYHGPVFGRNLRALVDARHAARK